MVEASVNLRGFVCDLFLHRSAQVWFSSARMLRTTISGPDSPCSVSWDFSTGILIIIDVCKFVFSFGRAAFSLPAGSVVRAD